eukprot:gnl/TRDRNA2_/TRDRNA2_191974_c0_seq1.p1 gnl/TRDRNA2_/TRDRNA2_191974_c0~~gnl/TRDRNA2_/TRDRNA2_191974_c0_seq1.p1  ORF type:complete len:202 (-),score=34.07 gnl/TRDRNA2_/TRDRNA2_191974_c0_seq1:25-603(-)
MPRLASLLETHLLGGAGDVRPSSAHGAPRGTAGTHLHTCFADAAGPTKADIVEFMGAAPAGTALRRHLLTSFKDDAKDEPKDEPKDEGPPPSPPDKDESTPVVAVRPEATSSQIDVDNAVGGVGREPGHSSAHAEDMVLFIFMAKISALCIGAGLAIEHQRLKKKGDEDSKPDSASRSQGRPINDETQSGSV